MVLKIAGETSIQFSDYVAVVARRKFVLVLATLVGMALALGYSYGIAQPAYVSQASVLVQPVLDHPWERAWLAGTEPDWNCEPGFTALEFLPPLPPGSSA